MKVTVDEKELYRIVKKAVREAIEENIRKLKLEIISYADDEEMKEINGIFGSPKKYKTQTGCI